MLGASEGGSGDFGAGGSKLAKGDVVTALRSGSATVAHLAGGYRMRVRLEAFWKLVLLGFLRARCSRRHFKLQGPGSEP